MSPDDKYTARIAGMDMRERAAELVEDRAKTAEATANGHTHYGAQQAAIGAELRRVAADIRTLTLMRNPPETPADGSA